MKISYNWLKQYVDFDLTPDQLAEVLTGVGLEVDSIEKYESIKGGLQGLVIGWVKEVVKHPDADRLKITKVDVGNGEPLQIVCGGPNVAEGQKVVVALPGAELFPVTGEPFTIKKSKIRGAASEGMICAEDEIGLSESHAGVMVLPADLKPGMKAAEYFKPYTDYSIEVNITPNRGDAMSHIGIARDVVAWLKINGKKDAALKSPALHDLKGDNTVNIEVTVENTDACRRYSGITFSNITVKESPEWLKNYLKTIGLRPINNIVDITNFVMYEYGQPLHAFDVADIKGGKIIVKNLPAATPFKTLDDKEIKLHNEDLMICDTKDGMCIAGVYGGLNSGVKDSTKSIFLESAWFHPVSVRKTANRLQLRTDAAIRFEKGANIEITVTALQRAATLILELAGGNVSSSLKDVYPAKYHSPVITLGYSRLNAVAGYDIQKTTADDVLQSLGFVKQEEKGAVSEWAVPAYKNEVLLEEDLVEEVMRVNGYDKIPVRDTFSSSLSYTDEQQLKEKFMNHVQDYLAGIGFNEVQNNSIFSAASTEKVFPDSKDDIIRLLAYSNSGLDSLRTNMLLPILNVVRHNINHRQLDLKLFEVGKVYSRKSGKYVEEEKLVLLLTGAPDAEHWRTKPVKTDFYHLKSAVEALLNKLNVSLSSVKEIFSSPIYNYGLSAEHENKTWLQMASVNSSLLKEYDIKQEVMYAEINVAMLINLTSGRKLQFVEPSKYPAMRRDLALILPENIRFEQVEKLARQYGGKALTDVNLFDVYMDKKLGDHVKSYAVSFIFIDENRTLTDNDVDEKIKKLISRFETELNAKVRVS